MTTTETTPRPEKSETPHWYTDDSEHSPEHRALCREMRTLAAENDDVAAWSAFATSVHQLLDPELYEEALHADPTLLEMLWVGFEYGWRARAGETPGYV